MTAAPRRPREQVYRRALSDPQVRALWLATLVSAVGDYIGQGALLIMAHQRSGGQILGSATVFAIGALPALVSGALGGTWLDRFPRRETLIVLQVIGAAAIVLPVVAGGLVPVFAAAAVLAALRAATISVRSAVMAEGVPDGLRAPLLGLLGTTEQLSQVVGYLTGTGLSVLIGPEPALLADAVSFLVAAAALRALSLPPPRPRSRRPRATAGLQDIWGHPVLRLLALLVIATGAVSAIPEGLAAGVAAEDPGWTPILFAAAPSGQALASLLMGRTRHVERPSVQLTHLAALALAFGVAALGRSPAWFALSNLLVGAGIAWLIGPQLTFVRLAPRDRMAQVTGTMVAGLIAAEGIGTPLFAALADRTSVATAYRAAGILVLVVAIVGWVAKERTPAAEELEAAVAGELLGTTPGVLGPDPGDPGAGPGEAERSVRQGDGPDGGA